MDIKKLKKELECDYINTVYSLRKAIETHDIMTQDIENENYNNLCQTLALLYMKEKGYNNIPNIGYIFGFQYDEVLEDYVIDDRRKV